MEIINIFAKINKIARALIIKINSQNPQERLIQKAVDILKQGGIIIYPTDSVYAIGGDLMNREAVKKIYRLKGATPGKNLFSFVCEDIGIIGDYAENITTPIYRIFKAAWPGPYTFILKASKKVPKHFQSRRKTVGIRVVDNPITQMLVKELGNPIISSSLMPDEREEYMTNPELMHEKYRNSVDLIIDGGIGGTIPTTVIDVSQGEDNIIVLREGAGSLEKLNLQIEE